MVRDEWAVAGAYEAFIGRWSRQVAPLFVRWLGVPAGRRWLDVGCGTGALSAAVRAAGGFVCGVDPSRGFVAGRADVVVGDARALPFRAGLFDAVVSGLALNFVPDAGRAVDELARVAVPGATVAAYVWDYAEGMTMLRLFWDAAREVDPSAPDEGARFALCRPEPLADLWRTGGLTDVRVEPIEIPTKFADFDAYWTPFLGGQGAAPAYLMTLPDETRLALRESLRGRLPERDIHLTARAWAVCGTTS